MPGSQRPLFMRMMIWAGAILATLGQALLVHRRPRPAPPPPSCSVLLADLTAQSQKIAAHALRLKIGEVVTHARTLLNYLQTRPDVAALWPDFVRDSLRSALAGTHRFADLSPHLTDPTDPAVLQFSQFLTALAQTLGCIYDGLTGAPGADASPHPDTYRTTLQEINRLYLDADKIP